MKKKVVLIILGIVLLAAIIILAVKEEDSKSYETYLTPTPSVVYDSEGVEVMVPSDLVKEYIKSIDMSLATYGVTSETLTDDMCTSISDDYTIYTIDDNNGIYLWIDTRSDTITHFFKREQSEGDSVIN